ncbi:putative bifunctional diguanylate cyclase/phosphodiesterase [Alcaligenes sp. SDU_A2]|uniref:putative bifunctional diguanylate cyclase/phosphodiesterase n=1 Tax=Alcaligenes sp. SDU_A2 TaxID=3136634 RepID=UPI00311FF029
MTVSGIQIDSLEPVSSTSERLIRGLSFYVIPLFLILLTLWALFFLPNRYPAPSGQVLSFHALASTQSEPDAALIERLTASPAQRQLQVDKPHWLLLALGEQQTPPDQVLYFPAAHFNTLHCLQADTEHPLTVRDHSLSTQALRSPIQGYTLEPGNASAIVCRIDPAGSSQLHIERWAADDIKHSSIRYTRGVGLLEGGLLTIALFMLILAATNREWTYLLLAVWLIGNLRLGSMAMGWDMQWLGHTLPAEIMPVLRRLTIACYFVLSYSLFTLLLRSSIHSRLQQRWLHSVGLLSLTLLPASLLAPAALFQPLMWFSAIYALCCAGWVLLSILLQARSRVMLWQLVLLSMALCVLISAIFLAAFGRSSFVENFNGVITLLLSNLLVALAVGERLRDERSEALRARNELMAHYILTPIGMFTLNEAGVFIRMNPVLATALGVDFDPAGPTIHWTDFFPEQNWQTVAQNTLAGNDINIERSDTHLGQYQFTLRAAIVNQQIEGSLQDITARAETLRKLRLMADNDPVTNVLNQRGIEKALNQAMSRSAQDKPCLLAYLDLNHIKYVNGTFGHSSGDALLLKVCEQLEAVLQAGEKVGRIGSDEFVIIFEDCEPEQARALANEVIDTLNKSPLLAGNRSFNLRSTMGLVEVAPNMSPQDAISAASRAAREARRQHQSMVVYDQGSNALQEHAEELRLFEQLEGGSSRGLYLEMQPIVSLRRPIDSLNFEVLLRVRDSSGQLIPTGRIISAAEESGTITIIDKWVFAATLEWMSKHEKQLARTQLVNINLSGVSLNDDKFIQWFFDILARYEHLARKLCVEITEGVALDDLEHTRHFMRRLQQTGVRIALDDFGAGYTSFSYLRELPADAIKIDGALICDMLNKETNVAIVRTIVELARNLGMISIAEWVEDVPTLLALQEIGVDYVQGFIISAACTPADLLNATAITDLVKDEPARQFLLESQQKHLPTI